MTLPKPMTSCAKSDGRFGKQDFVYLSAEDVYRCPAGEKLTYHYTNEEAGKVLRRYWTTACPNWASKTRLAADGAGTKIPSALIDLSTSPILERPSTRTARSTVLEDDAAGARAASPAGSGTILHQWHSSQPSKPSKPGFEGFEGAPP